MPPEFPRVIAAIDIGTTSLHLLVARATAPNHFDLLTREKEPVRLGSGRGDFNLLADDAIDRAVEVLTRFGQIAAQWDATIHAVATSAVREAANRSVFIERARDEAGIDVSVIAGPEEARLIHLGVIRAVPVAERKVLCIDIGGGSTEFVLAEGSEIISAQSKKLGAIRLTDRFFPKGKITKGSIVACRAYIRSFLLPESRQYAGHRPEIGVASSGTALAVASIVAALAGKDPVSVANAVVARADIGAVVEAVTAHARPKDRRSVPGLETNRDDLIVAGAILLEEIMDQVGLSEVTVTDYALREGLLFDILGESHADGAHELNDVRLHSVLHLVGHLDPDPVHAIRVSALALSILKSLRPIRPVDRNARELLEAGALLANIGLSVAHSSHHKHSYYLVRHSDQLRGFTDTETELIATIARYHRKSKPKAKHPQFCTLGEPDQELVRLLAGILRIAIGLDRSHAAVVAHTTASIGDDEVVIEVHPAPEADMTTELYSAAQRAGLLAEALGRTVTIAAADAA